MRYTALLVAAALAALALAACSSGGTPAKEQDVTPQAGGYDEENLKVLHEVPLLEGSEAAKTKPLASTYGGRLLIVSYRIGHLSADEVLLSYRERLLQEGWRLIHGHEEDQPGEAEEHRQDIYGMNDARLWVNVDTVETHGEYRLMVDSRYERVAAEGAGGSEGE